ncbi:MAG: undecaprenyldiphospho-muramoylpentapeptide beta-N-acetylglucosaminyltransferase [Bacteroidales bacterium]|jgi:UDP-N-acetylglucosamine--N-acetylmuramyl-(pentapeptide) pyrophosphoryl-undecaprenol N-acetylglucosamine transferase|nr:undecaprenyldiphospho-muramoylpentapeptide beta-N-acetylglucosaminyltransferase [Bacteroidales bacterium]MCI2122531.1 undecaprenyldiphospho-muramoylpentapeptide beta-N-acetylglucosaminyltransferase [Bacteroidales bacterium]MCI2145568.1 undecaprenyldiphospho-muramoylpentapeptide beta-N-acetylglucosaminyltransferase [Bacteroidales bacterium]
MSNDIRIIISGGGTGGHIFPAISIANALKEKNPATEILFVGALGRMEMSKVPEAGYKIEGLPVTGLQRKFSLSNLVLPFKLLRSIALARNIIRKFKPDVAVGVGGYASGPLLWAASGMGIPCLIQEQNSFAGLTNRKLSNRVQKICVAYEGMEKYFPKEKIILTGNPIRSVIDKCDESRKPEARKFYGLDPGKKTVFVVGGSLGCRTLNEVMEKWVMERAASAGYQILWQCGKAYKDSVDTFMADKKGRNVVYSDFIRDMEKAYTAADLVVSRAGAGTISELCVAGKATVFVPSPLVAEDHQTHNAMALVGKGAAIMIKDSEALEKLVPCMEGLLNDPGKIRSLEEAAGALARKDAAQAITNEVIKLIRK